jgi:hypothetical protein
MPYTSIKTTLKVLPTIPRRSSAKPGIRAGRYRLACEYKREDDAEIS